MHPKLIVNKTITALADEKSPARIACMDFLAIVMLIFVNLNQPETTKPIYSLTASPWHQ
jgi:hypothetical protein